MKADSGFKLIQSLSLFLIAFLILNGCSAKKPDQQIEDKEVKAEKLEVNGVQIFVDERSPKIPFAKARLTFPNQGEVLEDADVFIVVKVENFSLVSQTGTQRASEIANSAKGQHVHLIVDNNPYKAVYEAGTPINIGRLGPGPHTVFVFPSRSYHESVKTPGAADLLNLYVEENESDFALTKDTPSIIYSRPKGEYKGKATNKIMLDFYLNNVHLSPNGYKARYLISKKEISGNVSESYTMTLDQWKPAFITGLTTGNYLITLELIDKDGNLVPGAYNRTEREITVITEIAE